MCNRNQFCFGRFGPTAVLGRPLLVVPLAPPTPPHPPIPRHPIPRPLGREPPTEMGQWTRWGREHGGWGRHGGGRWGLAADRHTTIRNQGKHPGRLQRPRPCQNKPRAWMGLKPARWGKARKGRSLLFNPAPCQPNPQEANRRALPPFGDAVEGECPVARIAWGAIAGLSRGASDSHCKALHCTSGLIIF